MNKSYLIIFSFIFLISCCLSEHDTYQYVDKKAFPIYKLNDSLIYFSNWNNYDTLIFNSCSKRYDVESQEDYCDTKKYIEYLWVTYTHIHYESNNIYLSADHEIENNGIFTFKGFSGGFGIPLDDSVIIDGKAYYPVYFSDYKDFMNTNIKNTYYSFQYGLIGFQEKDGQVWSLRRNN